MSESPKGPQKRCGRIDDHPAHRWTSPVTHMEYRCAGPVTVAGGERIEVRHGR